MQLGLGLGLVKRNLLRDIGGKNPFQDATVAYSLRDLDLGVTTNVVRVRRSSDNLEQDFTATQVTDGTLTAFCGVGDGFVSVWYDQTGVYNASQATASSQPKIVSLGNLVLQGTYPTPIYDTDFLSINNPFDFVQNTLVFTINAWVQINDLTVTNGFVGSALSTSDKGFGLYFLGTDNSLRIDVVGGGFFVIRKNSQANVITDNNPHFITAVGIGNDVRLYVDGIETSYQAGTPFTSLSTGATTNPAYIGANHNRGDLFLPLKGLINDLNISDTSYTQEQIDAIYNNRK